MVPVEKQHKTVLFYHPKFRTRGLGKLAIETECFGVQLSLSLPSAAEKARLIRMRLLQEVPVSNFTIWRVYRYSGGWEHRDLWLD